MPVPPETLLLYTAGAAALVLCAAVWRLRRENRSLARRAAALEDELRRLSQEKEYRVERFDALWFPVVHFSAAARTVEGVKPGPPHCKACVEPLAAAKAGGAWLCQRCGTSVGADLANLTVADLVGKEALRMFLERHKDYKPAKP